MTTRPSPVHPSWADLIDTDAISGRRGEVSATGSSGPWDPENDGPRWILRSTAYGPNGGRRGDVELVLDTEARDALVAQLLAEPGTGPGDPAQRAAGYIAEVRTLAAEVDTLVEQINDGDAPESVWNRREQIDHELAALALELLGGRR